MTLPRFIFIDEYFEYYPKYSSLLKILRSIILDVSPKITDRIRYNCPFFDYHGMFISLSVRKNSVVLGFVEGVLMSDESGVFIPTSLQQLRYLQYKTMKDIKEELITAYVHEAMLIQEMKIKKVKK